MGIEDGFFKRSDGSTAERAAKVFGIDPEAAAALGRGLGEAREWLSDPGRAAVYASGIAEGRLVELRAAFDPQDTPPTAA